jgi:hypothetical protein
MAEKLMNFTPAWLVRQRAYIAHRDPATAAANLIAVVVALNGPLYPIYGMAVIGVAGWPLFLTMLASPFFFIVPRIARRSATAGRVALPLFGTLDTLYGLKLFGTECGMALFLLPCIVLAGLLFRPGERWLGLILIGLGIVPILLPAEAYGPPLFTLAPAAARHLTALNLISVAMLLGLIALQLRAVLAQPSVQPVADLGETGRGA